MKIAFVLDDGLDKSDGVQQYVLTLGHWYHTQGHEVHYIVGETQRTDIAHVHSMSRNIQAHFNQNRMTTPLPASKNDIEVLLQDEQFDVLHVQMPHSPLMAARVVKAAPSNTAVVGTFHIIPFSRLESVATWALGLVLRRNLKHFDAIYSVSEPAKHFAKKSFHVQSTVLPNVVDSNHFKRGKPIYRTDSGTLNIVFLGRLVERKGCMYLLQAIQQLHEAKKLERVKVHICGKGPLQTELEAYVHDNHLSHIVHFVGFVDEDTKADYFASADIAVLPSTGGESFGIVLIEAMASGADVVLAGDNVGYRSVMQDREDQLVDATNTTEFARKLDHFITSHRARQSARKWQQDHVKQFDVRVVGQKLLHNYEQLIAKKRNSADNTR